MVSINNKGDFWGYLIGLEVLTALSMYSNIFWDRQCPFQGIHLHEISLWFILQLLRPSIPYCLQPLLVSESTCTSYWSPKLHYSLAFSHLSTLQIVTLFRDSTCYLSPYFCWSCLGSFSDQCLNQVFHTSLRLLASDVIDPEVHSFKILWTSTNVHDVTSQKIVFFFWLYLCEW